MTVRGSAKSNLRMVTDDTLDREGFFIPEPPQRCGRRVKSAVNSRDLARNQLSRSSITRPKSAKVCYKGWNHVHVQSGTGLAGSLQPERKTQNNDRENTPDDINDVCKSKKMSVNQKWVYKGETPKWKPRNSQAPESHPTKKLESVRQRITVCEVMRRMRSEAQGPGSSGPAAPPSSPKSSSSALVGQRFVNERPTSPQNYSTQPNYLKYAKSKTKTSPRHHSRPRKSFTYLQEDMTVTDAPSCEQREEHPDVIQIPTMDMYDEPDEESCAVVEDTRKRDTDVYTSVYLKDYREQPSQNKESRDQVRLGRPKTANNYVRYSPECFRFQDHRYTKEVQAAKKSDKNWDRDQPRAPVGNTRVVSKRRPNSSVLYSGVS